MPVSNLSKEEIEQKNQNISEVFKILNYGYFLKLNISLKFLNKSHKISLLKKNKKIEEEQKSEVFNLQQEKIDILSKDKEQKLEVYNFLNVFLRLTSKKH